MKYFPKQLGVDAQQYDGSFDLDFLREGESIRAGDSDGSLIVLACAAGAIDIYRGEWVIRDDDGDLRVLSDNGFRAWYVLPEEAPDA